MSLGVIHHALQEVRRSEVTLMGREEGEKGRKKINNNNQRVR